MSNLPGSERPVLRAQGVTSPTTFTHSAASRERLLVGRIIRFGIAITVIPAAAAARMPLLESSTAAQRAGGGAEPAGGREVGSPVAGLPRGTSSDETVARKAAATSASASDEVDHLSVRRRRQAEPVARGQGVRWSDSARQQSRRFRSPIAVEHPGARPRRWIASGCHGDAELVVEIRGPLGRAHAHHRRRRVGDAPAPHPSPCTSSDARRSSAAPSTIRTPSRSKITAAVVAGLTGQHDGWNDFVVLRTVEANGQIVSRNPADARAPADPGCGGQTSAGSARLFAPYRPRLCGLLLLIVASAALGVIPAFLLKRALEAIAAGDATGCRSAPAG